MTSESMGATQQVVSSAFNRKLHPDIVPGGLFDSEAGLSTSILNEYLNLHSQPVDSSHFSRGGSFNEKAKLKNSLHPDQINSSMEGKQDPHQSGASYTSRKFNLTEISEGLFENKEESISSGLQESTHALSLPTAQNSEHTNDTEKINSKTIGRNREKGVATQKPSKDLFGSSNFSKQSHGALFSGGLFDEDDELVSSSPLESVHVWSQPSVPERLYGSYSDEKKNELSPSTSISSTANKTESNSSDNRITANIQVSAESKSQFSGTEQLEKTLGVNNEFSTGAPEFPNNGKQSLKERLSPLQKGLFDSGESDEDDDPFNPFRAPSSIGQKLRLHDDPFNPFRAPSSIRQKLTLHDRALGSDSSIMQESSKVGAEFNIPNTKLTDFSEPHKVEQLHSTGAFGRTEGMFPVGDYHSNITGFENAGVEGRTADSDDRKKFGTPVDLTVKYALHPKKSPFPSPVMPSPKEDPLHHSVTVASMQNQSDYDSDSWSSSSSEKTFKSSIPDVKANMINNYEINNSSDEQVVLEAKGISDPAEDSTSMLREEGSVYSTHGGSLLEPTHGGTEYFSKKQEYTGKEEFSLPVSLSEFETLPVDQCMDERRVEATPMLNQSIGFLNTSVLRENQSKDIQREEYKAAHVDGTHFHRMSSSSTQRDLEDGVFTFVSSCASLFKNEELVTASGENIAVDAPKKTSGGWQTDSLQSSNDPLQDSSQYAQAELDDKTKDGQTGLANLVQVSECASGHFTRNIQKEPYSISSSSLTQKDDESDKLISPSDKETKSNLSHSSISSQLESFPNTSLSYQLEETKVPSIYSQLFGDEDEGEGNLFGALPKTNPVIASLLKSPGKRLSLFDSDEE